jgi:hypothetical protein
MLRGTAEVGDTDGSTLQVELDLRRVTWWEGFTSGSVTVD